MKKIFNCTNWGSTATPNSLSYSMFVTSSRLLLLLSAAINERDVRQDELTTPPLIANAA